VKPFCRQGSIAEPFPRRVDLIICIEVVEHMPRDEADAAVINMCAHADDILFSSSPNDHREPTHINVRPAEDWAEQFARHGFFRDTEFDATFISPWAVRFRKSSEPVHRLIRAFERRLARLEQERGEMRAFTAEAQAQRAHAEAQLAQTSEVLYGEIEGLRSRVEPLQAEVGAIRQSLERAQAEVGALRQTLESTQAEARAQRETIHNMEKSVFWKIRRLFGR
jgi:hypothetical protein